MRIYNPVNFLSQLTVDADVDFESLYQAINLASPASGEALRKGNKDIENAEIADTAAIAYSKLALALAIVNADIDTAAAIAYSKLNLTNEIVNADIDDAAAIVVSKLVNTLFPETLMTTRGDILFRNATVPDRLAKGTANFYLKQGADDPEWAEGGSGEGQITVDPYNYVSIGQGSWSLSYSATYINGYIWLNGNADSDNVSYQVFLAAGTYTIRFYGTVHDNKGIMDIYFDAAEVGSIDWYGGAGETKNSLKEVTGIVVADAGLVTLKLDIDGKNGSSSGYYLVISSIALWRTA